MRQKPTKQSDDTLQRLSDLQRLGQALFEREAGRLAAKHGVEDPRTQRMIRTASGAGAMLTALETARDSAPEEIKAASDEIVVYGRVMHTDLKGATSVEITLEDANGRVMRAAGSATTDASGRYALRIPTGVAERLAGKDYLLTARDAKGEVIYRAGSTLKLDLSQAVRADVQLGARQPIRRPTAVSRRPRPEQPIPDAEEKPADLPRKERPTETVVFSVNGRVVRADGKAVAGVLVRVYDKDRQYDDLLGAALTTRSGQFSIRYRHQDFSEGETNADLFFVVTDASNTELLSTVDTVKFNAESETTITLTVPQENKE